jgi:hypothetical protein
MSANSALVISLLITASAKKLWLPCCPVFVVNYLSTIRVVSSPGNVSIFIVADS